MGIFSKGPKPKFPVMDKKLSKLFKKMKMEVLDSTDSESGIYAAKYQDILLMFSATSDSFVYITLVLDLLDVRAEKANVSPEVLFNQLMDTIDVPSFRVWNNKVCYSIGLSEPSDLFLEEIIVLLYNTSCIYDIRLNKLGISR